MSSLGLKNVSPENPQYKHLFYAGFDEETQEWVETIDTTVNEDDPRLLAACQHKDGLLLPARQELALGNGKMHLVYYDDDNPDGILVAEGYVIQENETSPGIWETYLFTQFKSEKTDKDKTKSKVNKGELTAEDETASIDIDITWKNKNKKQLYTAKHKTLKKRLRATIRLDRPDIATYNYEDYDGVTLENPYEIDGVSYVDILFEPDGTFDDLIVDPYLSIDETSTYIDVTCDGYVLRISTDGNTSAIIELYTDEISRGTFYTGRLYVSGTAYSLGFATNYSTVIKVDEPTVKQLLINGSIKDIGQNTLTNQDGASFLITCYADRFAFEVIYNFTGAGVSLDDSTQNRMFWTNLTAANLTNEDAIRENTTEVSASPYVSYDSDVVDYVGVLSDEVNTQIIQLTSSENSDYYSVSDVRIGSRWNNVTLTGECIFACQVLIDSAERENGSKLYTSTERLEQGDQYKDQELDLTSGTAVTSVPGLTAIGSDGFFSDGAWHFEGDTEDGPVKWDWDITRHNPKVVYETGDTDGAPTLHVDDSEVTLNSTTGGYSTTNWYYDDITTTAQSGVTNYLITMPADSEVADGDTWEINKSDTGVTLVVADISQAQTLGNVTLTQQSTIVTDSVDQAQTLENVVLVQQSTLDTDPLTQAQTLENVVLVQQSTLDTDPLTQAQTLENVTLSTATILAIADLVQSQALENVALVQQSTINTDNVDQAQALEGVTLSTVTTLDTDPLTQAQTLEGIVLDADIVLAIADMVQAQTLDELVLT